MKALYLTVIYSAVLCSCADRRSCQAELPSEVQSGSDGSSMMILRDSSAGSVVVLFNCKGGRSEWIALGRSKVDSDWSYVLRQGKSDIPLRTIAIELAIVPPLNGALIETEADKEEGVVIDYQYALDTGQSGRVLVAGSDWQDPRFKIMGSGVKAFLSEFRTLPKAYHVRAFSAGVRQ